MTILERLLRHDAWTTRSLLALSRELSDAELDREFDIGHGSLRRTFVHIIANMECWCDLMAAKPQRWSVSSTKPANTVSGLTERLDIVAEELLTLGRLVADEKREVATPALPGALYEDRGYRKRRGARHGLPSRGVQKERPVLSLAHFA